MSQGRFAKGSKPPAAKKRVGRPPKAKGPLKPMWKVEDEHKLLSPEKIEILNHEAIRTYWIGAKDAGKTRPVITRQITLMESNPKVATLSLKKYKYGAAERLHQAINNIALRIKGMGYAIPDYEKSVTVTYRVTNKKQKNKNQSIEYGAFDDSNGLAGIEAKNLGYFAMVHIEEPVLLDDENKLPSKKEWEAQMKTIEDSVNRNNRDYMSRTGTDIPPVKYHFTMNPWDDHPIIVDAEGLFPEEDFLKWAKQDLLANHTKAVYYKEKLSLYVRTTKLANPVIREIERMLLAIKVSNIDEWLDFDKSKIDWENGLLKSLGIFDKVVDGHLRDFDGKTLLSTMHKAIKEDNSYELARLLGMKYEGSQGNAKTYNLDKLQVADTISMLEKADVVYGMSVGWDIDVRRQAVATPIYWVGKLDRQGVEHQNLLIGKQRKFAMSGDTYRNGQADMSKIELYEKSFERINKEIHHELIIKTNNKRNPYGNYLYIDENKAQYMSAIMRGKPFAMPLKAKKHGKWDIMKRQDNVQLGIDTFKYVIDKSNSTLLMNLKKSIIAEGSVKRDESKKLEKNYDEINSMEYALYPFRGMLYGNERAGSIDLYKKEDE